jgi:hypothetical protein
MKDLKKIFVQKTMLAYPVHVLHSSLNPYFNGFT